jgi:pilus assembly protein Flp/PilA
MNTIVTLLVALQDRLFGADEERGATATEYALLLAFIAIVIIGAVTLLGTNLSGLFNNAASSV